MNIASLLHHELMLVARARVAKNQIPPKFTFKEELAMLRANRSLKHDSAENQALSMYNSVSVLMEYQQLIVETDNECYRIFEAHRMGSQERLIKRFWKYYIPISKSVHKSQKLEAARYSLLRVLDEMDQNLTFGCIFRPDASFVKDYDMRNRSRAESRKDRNAAKYMQQQKDRPLYESYLVEDGGVRSSYMSMME